MSKKIGRNDPCHCGSGKKYKRCHLDEDLKLGHFEDLHGGTTPEDEPAADRELPTARLGLKETIRLLREEPRHLPKKERVKVERSLATIKPLLAYMERREEVTGAATALEAHRAEFEKLLEDEPGYEGMARALFAEERFGPLWFTAADIRRAFEKVGDLGSARSDEETVSRLRAAILFLADKDRRSQLGLELLLQLPDYVAAGRNMEGWLIQDCAEQTVEFADEPNAFLFEMFSHGYDAWAREEQAKSRAILREVGLDPARLENMTMADMDAWIEEHQADPVASARMEALMKAHPERQSQAMAQIERAERDAWKLLEREDARHLLLQAEDVVPWLPALDQVTAKIGETVPKLSDDNAPDEAASQAFLDLVWPLMGEMAQGIFTPARVQQLLVQLKRYRDERFAAGDKRTANIAAGAILSLREERCVARNFFLCTLCFHSLRTLGRETGDSEPEEQ